MDSKSVGKDQPFVGGGSLPSLCREQKRWFQGFVGLKDALKCRMRGLIS